ncbi:MAG: cytochrome c [Magnetospirillum sp. WYHS-4]
MNRSILRAGLAALAVVVAAGLVVPAALADGPADIVDKRIKQMKKMRTAMTGMKQVVAESALDKAKAEDFSNTVATESKVVVTLFPAGSNVAPTEALPAVWDKPADFKAAADKATAAADAMLAAAKSGDMGKVKETYEAMRKACDGCHDNFLKN